MWSSISVLIYFQYNVDLVGLYRKGSGQTKNVCGTGPFEQNKADRKKIETLQFQNPVAVFFFLFNPLCSFPLVYFSLSSRQTVWEGRGKVAVKLSRCEEERPSSTFVCARVAVLCFCVCWVWYSREIVEEEEEEGSKNGWKPRRWRTRRAKEVEKKKKKERWHGVATATVKGLDDFPKP